MADKAIAPWDQLILTGLDQPGLESVEAQLDTVSGPFAELCGPCGDVIHARDMGAGAEDPTDSTWQTAVGFLFEQLEVTRRALAEAGLQGYEVRSLDVAVPNPRFQAPRQWIDLEGNPKLRTVTPSEAKYVSLDAEGVLDLVSQAGKERFPEGLEGLAVVMRLREPF